MLLWLSSLETKRWQGLHWVLSWS